MAQNFLSGINIVGDALSIDGTSVISSARHAAFVNLTTTGDTTLGNAVTDGMTINGNTTINTTGVTNNLILTSTDTSASSAPDLVFYRNAAIADSDTSGVIEFRGRNAIGGGGANTSDITYGTIYSRMVDVSDQDSNISFGVNKGNGSGALINAVLISPLGANNSATGALIINPATAFTKPLYNLTVNGTSNITGNATFAGKIYNSDGANATPSYTFASDTDTGMLKYGTNYLGFSTGGTNALIIDPSQNATFAGHIILKDDQALLDFKHGDADQVLRIEIDSGNDAYFSVTGSNDFYFRTNSTTALTLHGNQNASFAGNIYSPDSKYTVWGTGGDLKIHHNGTDSFVQNYTGHLTIQNAADDKDIIFQSDDGSGGVETYFFLDGSASSGSPYTTFPDNSNLAFGTGRDASIQHNGSRFQINSNGGQMYITQSANDGDLILESDNGSGGTTAYLTLDGGITSMIAYKDLLFGGDDVKAKWGASQDLEIYHSGSDSYIRDMGSGSLRITASKFTVLNAANNETMIDATENGSVDLYYDNSKKFETTSAGATVTGTLTATLSGTATGLAGTPNISVGTITCGNITTSGYLRGPASFVIDPATHGDDTGTVVIAGNLQVDGTTTTINSTTVSIDDLNFSIATDAANSAAANGAGITIGGAGATLLYTHATVSWDVNKHFNVLGGKLSVIPGSGAYDQIKIASNTTADTNKQAGIYTENKVGNNTSIMQYSCSTGNNTIYYGSADGNYRGITGHKFYVNASPTATSGHTEALDIASNTNATFAGNVTSEDTFILENSSGKRWQQLFDSNNWNIRYYNGSSWSADALAIDTSNNATFAGAVSLTGGALSISGDGSNAATLTESGGGDFTIAAVDDLRLTAGGNDIVLRGASSAEFARLSNNSQDFIIKNITENKDIVFQGNDGNGSSGVNIDALKLDMSNAGSAFFNHDIVLVDNGKVTFGGGSDLQIYHDGSHNYIDATTTDQDIIFKGTDGGSDITALTLDMSEGGNATFAGNLTVQGATTRLENNVTIGNSSADYLEVRYNNTADYATRVRWNGIQFGNNGEAKIIAGRTSANGWLNFYVNNQNDGLANTPDGSLALTLAANTNATFSGTVKIDHNDGLYIKSNTSTYHRIYHNTSTNDLAFSNAAGGDFDFENWIRVRNGAAGTINFEIDSTTGHTGVGGTRNASYELYVHGAQYSTGAATFAEGISLGDEKKVEWDEVGVRSWDMYPTSGDLFIASGDSAGNLNLTTGLIVADNATFAGDVTVGSASTNDTVTIYGNTNNLVLRSQTSGTKTPELKFNISGTDIWSIQGANNRSGVSTNTLVFDQAGTIKHYFFTDGNVTHTGMLSATYYRDIDNTVYYTDPATLAVLNKTQVGTVANGTTVHGSKGVTLVENTFTTGLTVVLANHTSCYVKVFITGDWTSHSAVTYLGEFFLQNGAGGYGEPGMIIREVDNTLTDTIEGKIVDPSGTSGNRNFAIQFRANDTVGANNVAVKLVYEVMGNFVSVS